MTKTVEYNGRYFNFRPCDTNDITQEELQEKADKAGYMQYEPSCNWLVIREIGYGWEVSCR